MRTNKRVSNEQRVLTALRQRRLVTRKTALRKGWCEDLTRTISRLRKDGYNITSLSCVTDEGERYTKYVLEAPYNSSGRFKNTITRILNALGTSNRLAA